MEQNLLGRLHCFAERITARVYFFRKTVSVS